MNRFFVITLTGLLSLNVCFAPPAPKEEADPEPTRAEFQKSQNNLKQLGIAMHSFHDANGTFPGNIQDKNGKHLLSWRVQLLPYVEEVKLYKEFKLDEAWDSEHNKKLLDQMPKVFAPVRGKAEKGTTFYQSFVGENALLRPKKLRITDITDGSSNTLMIVEAGKAIEWTKPDDLPFDDKKDVPALGGLFRGDFNAAFCDGSVRMLKKGLDQKTLKAMISINGGEVFEIP